MTNLEPRHDETLDFLRRFHPGRQWVVTAIGVEKKSIVTASFTDETSAGLLAWLAEHGTENLYFSVGEPTRPLTKKAERSDILAVHWLHVDVDPRAGEDLDAERARALKLLSNPPAGVPTPTAIVFSGGGYQGFWRLSEPVRVDGSVKTADDVARYNLQLELTFGGDHCHDVSRIMRLPGTVNWPDAKKRKKGRKPELARLVEWDEARTYPVASFAQARDVQAPEGPGFSGAAVRVSGNIQRIASTDELPASVPDICKVAINLGNDPDNPKKWGSRSEVLFYVCCELVRAGCDDDTIFAIITDPDFRISESVLDKGGSSERYALRQIERAREEAVHPALRRLNEKHAVIGDVGGRCRIISETEDVVAGMTRTRISLQSFEDFRNRYCNETVEFTNKDGDIVTTPLGKWWIAHPRRRQYRTMVFAPGLDVSDAYNLWRGFAYDAKPGDCSLFLAHVRDNICGGDEAIYAYVMGWLALSVQRPASPGHTAIVLRGRQGTGKGVFASTFGALFGRHFLPVRDTTHLVGQFNGHLRDCVVLFADEAFYAGNKKNEGLLKSIITEPEIVSESKGVDAIVTSNFVHLIMASNEDWVVPVGIDDRRFLVLDVSTGRMQDAGYFSAIREQMVSGGYEALLYALLTWDLSGFDVRRVPKTAALRDQKVHSFTAEEEWWYAKLVEGKVFPDEGGWTRQAFTSALAYDFTSYVRAYSVHHRGSATRLGRFLSGVMPRGWKLRGQVSGEHDIMQVSGQLRRVKRPHVYLLPPLEDCRKHWDANFGGPYDWKEHDPVSVENLGEKEKNDPF